MTRNRLDTEGYGGVPFEQTHPFIAGLIGGGVIVAASIWAMPAPSAPARATHEPSQVSQSRPSVSVAIAERPHG